MLGVIGDRRSGVKSVLIVTDAWHPQINGVVRSIERTSEQLTARGIKVHMLTPLDFFTVPMPGYSEIRLSMTTPGRVHRMIRKFGADAIHIATEGPLGFFARSYCIKNNIPFATSYHTQFPEYLRARVPFPVRWSYNYLVRFHGAAAYCLVGTPHLKRALEGYGLTNAVIWTKGVDTDRFTPTLRESGATETFPWARPIFLNVGRVAVEKNVEAFLKLDLPGTKIVVGEGPSRSSLAAAYPAVKFVGPKEGEELSRYFASADCFVFPSRTDTFGLVLLEALASGTPVAAFPVMGPLDVIGDAPVGVLDDDLKMAALQALRIPRDDCRAYASRFSWIASTDQFLQYLPEISHA